MKPPHINIGGPPGAGKSTVIQGLTEEYETVVIPNVAAYDSRLGEEGSPEYSHSGKRGLLFLLEPSADSLIGEWDEEFKQSRIDKGAIVIGDVVLNPTENEALEDLSYILVSSIHGVPKKGEQEIKAAWHPRYWPTLKPTTQLIVSAFGEPSREIKKLYAPEMINIFVTCKRTKDIKERLCRRNKAKGLSCDDVWLSAVRYLRQHPEKDFDYVVFNEEGELKKCIARIAEIAGLPPK
jgi:guanylate kinase